MKEITVISGKGGTGKTTLTASFACLAEYLVLVDCDVDAADLHLIMSPEVRKENEFYSGNEAFINSEMCTGCGKCKEICRFEAIVEEKGVYSIDGYSCEGCGVCVNACAFGAISFPERKCGDWYISDIRFGTMVHAKLGIGAENSGKLVSEIRKEARMQAASKGAGLILIDGPPGIGCPVIASITGADAVVVVTEPTLSGIHDLQRVMKLTRHFHIPTYVCINKWDINPANSDKIEGYCNDGGSVFLGKIPYIKEINKAQIAGMSVVEYSEGKHVDEIKKIWSLLKQETKYNL